MNTAQLVINIFLMLLTGIYVYLTHKMIKVSEHNTKEQLRLSSIPLLAVNIPRQFYGNNITLYIENTSNLPAFDIDIWISSMVSDKEFPLKEIYKKGVGKVNRNFLKEMNTESVQGYYSLYDRGVYAVLQGNYRIKLSENFKFNPYVLYLIIQYKDRLGNNYYQKYVLVSTSNENKRYIIDEITPDSLIPCNRFDFQQLPNKPKDKNIPKDLDYVYDLIKNGIFAERLTTADTNIVENKWDFEKIIEENISSL